MTLLPFSGHFLPAPSPLFRLHMDLVGPITPASISGFRYFLTVVDQFSSFKFVRFLKAKSDALAEVRGLITSIENFQGATVKEIMLDQGGEFLNREFAEFATTRGIHRVFTPAYTPQHNGFAERANRTILDKARCLLNSSNLPRAYWAEAINTATFLSNLLPTASRSNFSPYKLWTKTPPPLRRLKTFGCIAFFAVKKEHRSWKLAKTVEMGILVGFENKDFSVCSEDLEDNDIFFDFSSDPPPSSPNTLSDGAVVPAESPKVYATPPEELPAPAVPFPAQEIICNISLANIIDRPRCPRALMMEFDPNIPTYYHQAVNGVESASWVTTIKKELDAMRDLSVWSIVELTPAIKTIGSTWVFRKKKGASPETTECKARLCAQGFSQTYGVNFSKIAHSFHTPPPTILTLNRWTSRLRFSTLISTKMYTCPFTARKANLDGSIQVYIGCSHPRQTQFWPNRGNPSSDLKSVRVLQCKDA
ncbi:hypothetical protein PCASD_02215 [Puccinia coronata f. sp. avenae]|uniref:Integrase catalytic domain-containing protein n=1 Tax=Puccinia coronata f. sp. avenae TaxID=200324 RepID=A0A2N5VHU5_9BASI|nr:hypothetical protein PCASD_02215 [Puccinia coronata f. sp. avenae]